MIVKVTEDNLLDAARIHSISWQESHRSFCTEEFIELHDINHQKEYIEEKIKNGSQFAMLIKKEPVAVVSITDSLIEDLYVLPKHQNKGYGTELLDYAISQCKATPTLWILENNKGAERLYLRYGFKPTGNINSITDKLSEIEFSYTK